VNRAILTLYRDVRQGKDFILIAQASACRMKRVMNGVQLLYFDRFATAIVVERKDHAIISL
jgi:hypothetical protein